MVPQTRGNGIKNLLRKAQPVLMQSISDRGNSSIRFTSRLTLRHQYSLWMDTTTSAFVTNQGDICGGWK
jgi:hypothetical protein